MASNKKILKLIIYIFFHNSISLNKIKKMKRVFFSQNNDYKKITPFVTDPNFIPLAVM